MSQGGGEFERQALVEFDPVDEGSAIGHAGSRDAFVVFQGGGAKGISHIGALGALADAHINVLGVAGTSAGAIVAALTAAGYTAEDLLATDGSGKHLLTTIDPELTSATHLFGEQGWRELMDLIALGSQRPEKPGRKPSRRKVSILRNIGKWWFCQRWKHCASFLAAVIFLDAFPQWIAPHLHVRLAAVFSSWASVLGDAALVLLTISEGRWFFKKAWTIAGGLTQTAEIRRVINTAIVRKLKDHARREHKEGGKGWTWSGVEKDGMTFAQFAEMNGLPLRIVATDVTTDVAGLTVRPFSAEDTPSVVVADAVCASIGLPIVFKVKGISMASDAKSPESMRFFLDGGLLSNLPLWVFDEDRSLNRDALTVGFTLEQSVGSVSSDEVKDMPGFGWLLPAVESVVSGPQSIHHRAIEGLLLVSVPTGLGVLSLNQSNLMYCEEVGKARGAALEQLTFQLDFPAQLKVNLQALRNLIYKELDEVAAGTTALEVAIREFRSVRPESGLMDWQLSLSLLVQRPGFLRTLHMVACTDPTVTGPGKGTSVVPYSHFGLVWDWDAPVYAFDFFTPNLKPLSSGNSWWTALPIIPVVDPIDPEADAVILVVESPIRPQFLCEGPATQQNWALAMECLLAVSQAIEKSLEGFGLAFRQKYSQSDAAKKQLLEFDQHVRRAQIWQ